MKKKRYTVILSVLYVFESIAMLSIPYFSKNLIDYAQSGNKERVITYSVALGISAVISILFRVSGYLLYSRFSLKLEEEYKRALFDSITRKGFHDLSRYHSAEIEMLYTTDISHVISKKLSVIPSAIRMLTRFLLAVALLLYYDWKFLLVLFISGIFALGAVKLYSKYMKPRHKAVLEASGKSNSFIVEEKEGLKIIQAYQAEAYAREYYDTLLTNEMKEKRRRNILLYGGNSLFYIFSVAVYVGPIVYGAFGILNSWFTYGVLLALTELVAQIENPLIQMSPLLNQYNLAKASEERIEKAMSLPDMPKREPASDFESIEFRDVSFSYNEDHMVFTHMSFEIRKGDTVLLSGPSGIGKTTSFMLLLGFLSPKEGEILLHKDGKTMPMSSAYGALFSYVPQENVLFSGTIRENIRILTGKDDASIEDALRKANIYDEIMAMPDKLDTVLKDHGQGLSLGQIQRILIACAILHDAPVLLLDEFSSALDKENEAVILKNLKDMQKTIVYITHRSVHLENEKIIDFSEKISL